MGRKKASNSAAKWSKSTTAALKTAMCIEKRGRNPLSTCVFQRPANADLAFKATPRKNPRKIIEIKSLSDTKPTNHAVVQYSKRLQTKPKIAVITPHYKESVEMLLQCHLSVLNQDVEADVIHYMIGDGIECPPQARTGARYMVLPKSHGDNGNTPRSIGSILAEAEGADFIAFLDADNWFHPNHLASLLDLYARTGASICCSLRTFHQMDGSELAISEPDENQHLHVDTSCIVLAREAFYLNDLWHRMPRILSPICDRIFLSGVKHSRLTTAFSDIRSVAFRTQYANHFYNAGLAAPENSKIDTMSGPMSYLQSAEGVKECTNKLGFWPIFGV